MVPDRESLVLVAIVGLGGLGGVAETVRPPETSVWPAVRAQTRKEYCVPSVSPEIVAEFVALVALDPDQQVDGAVAPS